MDARGLITFAIFALRFMEADGTDPCSGVMVLSVTSSPVTVSDGPGNYNSNANCEWRMSSTGAAISISFTSFATEAGYDFVKVYRGSSANAASLMQTFSGSQAPGSVTVDSSTAVLAFTSDGSVDGAGFVGIVSSIGSSGVIVPPPTATPQQAVSPPSPPILPPAASGPCSGVVVLSVTSSPVTVSDGPGNYNSNANCEWRMSSTGAAISISFTSFATEAGYDFVKVYRGSSANAASLMQTFSGSQAPGSVTVDSSTAVLAFTSDGSVDGAGFAAVLTASATVPTVGQTSVPTPSPSPSPSSSPSSSPTPVPTPAPSPTSSPTPIMPTSCLSICGGQLSCAVPGCSVPTATPAATAQANVCAPAAGTTASLPLKPTSSSSGSGDGYCTRGYGLMPTQSSPSRLTVGGEVIRITDKLPSATLGVCKAECNKFEYCAGFLRGVDTDNNAAFGSNL